MIAIDQGGGKRRLFITARLGQRHLVLPALQE
jgi:hypothetical protein